MIHKKTKIVCTIGPSSWGYDQLVALAKAGMNVARLNFSHGNHMEKLEQIKNIRKISREIEKPIAILADMQGPKLRLGVFDGKRDIKRGDQINLALSPVGDELPIQFDLTPFLKKDHRIFLNDGLVELKVRSITNGTINTVAQNNGWVSSNKGVNVPDTLLKNTAFTPKDYEDATFALAEGVDYLALSFIQTKEDLEPVKKLIEEAKSKAKIIVKIEKKGAINKLEEIINATDAVMIARGDLGIELNPSEVPMIQERIIYLCRQTQTPVIVATHMLESMTENPRPTRAETSDVARAVMAQADAVMLSAETANGKYPTEAVCTMKEIILAVEQSSEFKRQINIDWESIPSEDLSYSAIVAAAGALAQRIKPKVIVVASASGRTAILLSAFRPDSQIVAVTHNAQVANQLSLVWGMRSVVEPPSGSFEMFAKNAIEEVQDKGFAKEGDKVIFVTGSLVGHSGSTDTIKVVTI